MDKDEYSKEFSEKKGTEAYKVALDTRKFEIELYWKRATYFWTFIAAAFAAYGLIEKIGSAPDRHFLQFLTSCLGFMLSLAWLLANRGSKQWQENWEHHVDHLEDSVTGPLFKVTLFRAPPSGWREKFDYFFMGPGRYSVSKINQLISSYIMLIWIVLLSRSPDNWALWKWHKSQLAIFSLTVVGSIVLLFAARTSSGPHRHVANLRESQID